MDNASAALLALKPVTFYKKEIDSKGIPQFGLVAEEVAKVNPVLVVVPSGGNNRMRRGRKRKAAGREQRERRINRVVFVLMCFSSNYSWPKIRRSSSRKRSRQSARFVGS